MAKRVVAAIHGYFRSNEDKLRVNLATSCTTLSTNSRLQCLINHDAYNTLQHLIASSVPTFSDDITTTILSYLCYDHFYFGMECTLNIERGIMVFNMFDVNGRLCYMLYSKVTNHSALLSTENVEGRHIVNYRFIGDRDSYKMQKGSKFFLKRSNALYLMKWGEDGDGGDPDDIPSILFIRHFPLNLRGIDDIRYFSRCESSMFISLKRDFSFFPQSRILEIRDDEDDRSSTLIRHEYHHYNSRHDLDHSAPFPTAFESKENVLRLFERNYRFRAAIDLMVDHFDCFVFDECVHKTAHDYTGSRYLNVAAIWTNRIVTVAKMWFTDTEYVWKSHIKLLGVKIVGDRLFIILHHSSMRKTFAGFFTISNTNSHPDDADDVQFVLECAVQRELENHSDGAVMGDIEEHFNDEGSRMIAFRVKTRNALFEYVLDDGLNVVEQRTVDVTGKDYKLSWCGLFSADYSVKMNSGGIIVKGNDYDLKRTMARDHRKRQATDGVLIIAAVSYIAFWLNFMQWF